MQMKKANIKIIKGLIKKFGKQASMDKIQEETLELSLALHQLKCPTKTNKKRRLDDVYQELADVEICMRMAKMLLSRSKINRLVNKKLKEKELKHLSNGTIERTTNRN